MNRREVGGRELKQFTSTVKSINAALRTVDYVISTANPDRDDDTIAVEGWHLDNYRKNPVVLWAHDQRSLPVAKAVDIRVAGRQLRATAKFATREEYPFADTVFRLIVGGYLNATSVGFMPLKYEMAKDRGDANGWPAVNFLEQELLEFSVVPVPANPEALLTDMKSKGFDIQPLVAWANRFADQAKGVHTSERRPGITERRPSERRSSEEADRVYERALKNPHDIEVDIDLDELTPPDARSLIEPMVKAALFENGRDSLDLEDDEDEIDLDSLDAGQFRSVLREAVDEGIAEMYARAAGKLPK